MSGHDHDHGHPQGVDAHAPIEEGGGPVTWDEVLEAALRELCIEKGVFSGTQVMQALESMDARRPEDGARLVARFWTDPDFRRLALENGKAAAEAGGIDMTGAPDLVFLENTPQVHHVVVCTLCSCYPKAVLGIPPAWYKSKAYRARVVREPRGVLKEFGTVLPQSVDVRVADSTAELRFLVVPLRPAGTEGLSLEHLAALVTRDSMVGVTQALSPSP